MMLPFWDGVWNLGTIPPPTHLTISSIADDAEDALQKLTQKRSTYIAVLPVRATSTALQPQKPTWN